MEAQDANSRPSALMSLIHRDKIEHINTDRPSYGPSSTMAGSAIVSPASMYSNGPPPPYSNGNWERTAPSHPASGLISPPDSRRTSDNKNEPPPPIQTQQPHRQSLPSIHEALSSGPKSNPYVSPVSASIPPSHQVPYSQPQQPPSIPRSYAPSDQAQYPSQYAPAQARQPSPPQPVHPSANPFSRREAGPGSFSEISRHPSLSAIQTGPAPPNPFAPRYEQQRYEQDPRALERTPNGYSHAPPPPPQSAYAYGPPPASQPPPLTPNGGPVFHPPIYDTREPRDLRDEWRGKPYEKPVDTSSDFRQGVKRHLDAWDFENGLAQINVSSTALQDWSKHYSNIAGEQPRLGNANTIPDRMPTITSANDMIEHAQKILESLERMRDVIKTSDQMKEDQNMREQRGKGISGYYDDDASLYGDDVKSHGYGPEGKKRRGRAAPPGRCHSCNRAETPEWRRGPDGARTLCNACGLHYAKLTRKNTMKQSQSSNGGSLRPKSMDGLSPRLSSK